MYLLSIFITPYYYTVERPKSLYVKTTKLTKKYKHLCGLQGIFRGKRCQRPGSVCVSGSILLRCYRIQQQHYHSLYYHTLLRASRKEVLWYNPVFDSDIWKNIAERLILYSFSGGAFSFYNIVFF